MFDALALMKMHLKKKKKMLLLVAMMKKKREETILTRRFNPNRIPQQILQ
jgi:hypothetical protein